MKKILFVAQNFQVGGVQRALINMLKTMPAENDIRLFTFGDGPLLQDVPANVRVERGNRLLRLMSTPFQVVLQSRNPLDIFLRVCLTAVVRLTGSHRLYRAVLSRHKFTEEFDVAISYFTDVPNNKFNQGTNQFVSEFTTAKVKLAWIHNDPIDGAFDKEYCSQIYEGFDKIVCVSHAVRERFEEMLPVYADKMYVYHNRFPEDELRQQAKAYSPNYGAGYHIVTVARIDNLQKRIDGIVKLCKRLVSEGVTDFRWHIIGGGPDLANNLALAKQLGVENVLVFEGEHKNPFPFISHADLFALYSAYEGFPMVVGEAQALGTKVLTTNYAAAKEQISSEQGIIVQTDEAFYEELKKLITSSKG